MWWVPSCNSGANTVTFTTTGSGYSTWYLAEYGGNNGAFTTAASAQSETASGANTYTSTATSAVASGDLFLGLWVEDGAPVPTSTTDGRTLRAVTANTVAQSSGLSETLSTSAGTQTAGFNLSGTATIWGGFLTVAFAPGAASSGSGPYFGSSAAGLAGGTGSWVNTGNVFADDAAVATWTAP